MNNDYRYVAFLDVLGMSNAIKKNPDEAWGALSDLRSAEIEIEKNYKIICPSGNEHVENNGVNLLPRHTSSPVSPASVPMRVLNLLSGSMCFEVGVAVNLISTGYNFLLI